MEEQYLEISEEQAKKLSKKGFKTYQRTSKSKKPGQDKIVDYVINLSDILSYLENSYDILKKIKEKNKELEEIEKEIKELREKVEKRRSEIEGV